MNNAINLSSNTIDLSTLHELRDPNLISRYPPLFQRKQNLITLDNSSNCSIKRSKTVSTNACNNTQKSFSLTPTISAPISNYRHQSSYTNRSTGVGSLDSKETLGNNKRHRFVKFLKHLNPSKPPRISRQDLLRQSISKPIFPSSNHTSESTLDQQTSVFMNSLYPTKSKNPITIKSDKDRNEDGIVDDDGIDDDDQGTFELSRRNTYLSQMKFQPMSPPQELSAVNSIVIPPVGGSQQIPNPEHFSSPIIHPNIHFDKYPTSNNNNTITKCRSRISFAKYDMMTMDTGTMMMTPVDDDDDMDSNNNQKYSDMLEDGDFVLPNSSFFIPTTTTATYLSHDHEDDGKNDDEEEEDDDDDESYYSFTKSPEEGPNKNMKSPNVDLLKSSRIVASPIYKIIRHNSPTKYSNNKY